MIALLVAAPLFLDHYRTFLLTEILIFGLFAASLDLLIGYAGLPSLGQGGYYGVGAYAAGLLALHVTTNAFAQILVAAAVAAGVAVVTGVFAVRSRGVYFLMLTLAFGQLLWVLALNWASVTGGSNGIFGIPTPTLAGSSGWLARSDHFYWYTLGVFLVGYAVLRLVVDSPFGARSTRFARTRAGWRRSATTCPSTSSPPSPSPERLAGYAGALACQQPRYFSPEGMSFEVSAVAAVVVIIGGLRSLVGGVIGAAVYYVLRDQLSGVLSSHWQLALGAAFVLIVYLLPGGVVGGARRVAEGRG